jgi:hypothetical protein
MADEATSTRSESTGDGDLGVVELREELARSREEILRLRDLLVGRDAELATARGRLAEIEAGAAPLVTLASRLRALVPGSAIRMAAGVRSRRSP